MSPRLSLPPRPHVGIVLFHPQFQQLDATLRAVLPEAERVFLFLNAPLSPEINYYIEKNYTAKIRILGSGANQGLGVAYNEMAAEARADGASFLMFLDQDSSPPNGMILNLLASLKRLQSAGVAVAAVGPQPVAAPGSNTKNTRIFPRAAKSPVLGTMPMEFIISSGTLLDLEALAVIGGFREDFFIDAIDIEWCFRASACGYSCWMAHDVVMPHQLGRGFIRVPLLGILLTVQPPFRAYSYARNQTAMLRLPHVPRRWKLRFLLHLILQVVMNGLMQRRGGMPPIFFVRGVLDGLRGHLGPVGPYSRRPKV